MNAVLSWLITSLVVVLLATFVLHVRSLGTLGTHDRPRTPTYDRFGRFVGLEENPDYRENPGEDVANGPEATGGHRACEGRPEPAATARSHPRAG